MSGHLGAVVLAGAVTLALYLGSFVVAVALAIALAYPLRLLYRRRKRRLR